MYGDIREKNLEISKVLNNISEEIYSIDDDIIGVEEIQDIIQNALYYNHIFYRIFGGIS